MRSEKLAKRLNLAVDFDNTCAISYWPKIGAIVPGARECLTRLKEKGCRITIWSGRNNKGVSDPVKRSEGLIKMKEVLDRAKIPYDAIDYGHDGKLLADLYIDDRALGTPLIKYQGHLVVDWPKAYNLIRLFLIKKRLS